eukprot:TRINITY_DN8628_c0_g3_i2.p1 TRINITY_DN8628_c0_g3~~TRINITY_DN8628_c0_g3_i2.p1  ORF type:complete len:335 (-),score=36.62 TRINITY_DN8628_c0_g3_i2:632-1636(-)
MMTGPKHYRHFCAGVLVSQAAVLTTAHCIKSFRPNLEEDIGDLSVPVYAAFAPQCRHAKGQYDRILVHTYRVHHQYQADSLMNDIAILKLERVANETIVPVDFRTSKSFRKTQQYGMMHVVGWGSVGITDHARDRFNRRVEPLKHAYLEAYDYGQCQQDLISSGAVDVALDNSSMLCAFSKQSDTCDGDSGGPLIVSDNLEDPMYDVLVGLTSFGPDVICGGSLYLPGVYTKVSSFVDWIDNSLKILKITQQDVVPSLSDNSVKAGTRQPELLQTNQNSSSTNNDEVAEVNPLHMAQNRGSVEGRVDPHDFKDELMLDCRFRAVWMGTSLGDCS